MAAVALRLFNYDNSSRADILELVTRASEIWSGQTGVTLTPQNEQATALPYHQSLEYALSAMSNAWQSSYILNDDKNAACHNALNQLALALKSILNPEDDGVSIMVCAISMPFPNGFCISGDRIIVVNDRTSLIDADNPTVQWTTRDERVLAHEVGHILLGIGDEGHSKDPQHLMANGTTGTILAGPQRAMAEANAPKYSLNPSDGLP